MRSIFVERARIAARATSFVQRHRQLDGPQFVQIVVASFLAHPDASYETMLGVAAEHGVHLSPQGLANRFDQRALSLLELTLRATMQQALAADPVVLPLLDRFHAVCVEDSTIIALPDALAERFPGCGGNRNNAKAACKAQFRWELRSGRLDGPILHEGRAADRAVSFRERVAKGTLRIRDLGYWQLDDLKQDADDGRFWLSRLKPGTALFVADGTRTELRELLTVDTPQQEWAVQIGVRQRLACRLIARRVSKEEQEARKRRTAKTAKRKGRKLTAAAEARCEWDVVVTNVPCEQLSADEVWILLSVRWQIELLFKLWKSHGKLDVSRGVLPTRVLCELYAKFIALLVQHWLLLAGCWQHADRSLVKAARVVRAWGERLFRALSDEKRLEALLEDVVAAIGRVRRQTRRKAEPGTWQLLSGVPAAVP
jgi:hypothetical protein